MDKNLYEIMNELLEEKKSDFTQDIEFLGTITSNEQSSTGEVAITKDIFAIVDELPDGTIIRKFYDNDKNFIAGCGKDGKLFPSAEFQSDDLSFMGQLQELANQPGLSLKDFEEDLENISKMLGVDKSKILSMSRADMDQVLEDKNEDKKKLVLDDDKKNVNQEEAQKQNKDALDSISSKQETKLDNKVTDRYTLADVLGVPAGSTLIAVYSDSIADNKNTTRFSMIIKYPDGTLHNPDMLEQDRGKYPDINAYETNRDGSSVEKKNVQSAYSIDSPIIENGILTVKIGQMGIIEMRLWSKRPYSNYRSYDSKIGDRRNSLYYS